MRALSFLTQAPLRRLFRFCLFFVAALGLHGCGLSSSASSQAPSPAESILATAALSDVVENFVAHERGEQIDFRIRVGVLLDTAPVFSRAAAREDARFARAAIRRLDGIGVEALSEANYLTLLAMRYVLESRSEHAVYYGNDLTVFSPGSSLADLTRLMSEYSFGDTTDLSRYVSLVSGLGSVPDSLRVDLAERAASGIVLSRSALVRAIEFFSTYDAPSAEHVLHVSPSRLTHLDSRVSARFSAKVDSLLAAAVAPAFRRLTTYLKGSYATAAPGGLGLWQYVGGKAYYGTLVRRFATLDITPEQAHEASLREVARLDSALRKVRQQIAGPVTADSFHTLLRQDARRTATNIDEVVDGIFLAQGSAPVDSDSTSSPVRVWPIVVHGGGPVAPGDRIFGMYRPPVATDSVGRYVVGRGLLSPGMLTLVDGVSFLALIPGWHELLGRQLASGLDLARYYTTVPAFVDGWGFTALDVAREQGALADPYAQYGALMLEQIACVRAAVDGGVHYFGWTEEQAKGFFALHTMLGSTDIDHEVARVAIDAPGSGLSGCLGIREIRGVRRWMQRELKSDFDARRFNREVSSLGPVPLQALGRHFEWWLYQERLRLRAKPTPAKSKSGAAQPGG
ncbi:MAG: DUF885 domain-containing protein [Gemmatimonadaceae bacterium]